MAAQQTHNRGSSHCRQLLAAQRILPLLQGGCDAGGSVSGWQPNRIRGQYLQKVYRSQGSQSAPLLRLQHVHFKDGPPLS